MGVAPGVTQRKKLDASFRNDSLSSDQSEYQSRPPPPRPHKHKKMKHQRSMSSSDEEIQSTPDCTSCGEEFESESISEKEYTHAMMDRFHREELLDARFAGRAARGAAVVHPAALQVLAGLLPEARVPRGPPGRLEAGHRRRGRAPRRRRPG